MNAHSTARKQFFRYVSQNILGMIGVSAYILALYTLYLHTAGR